MSCRKSFPAGELWAAALWSTGASEAELAVIAGCDPRTVRNWRERVCVPHDRHARALFSHFAGMRDRVYPDVPAKTGQVIDLSKRRARA